MENKNRWININVLEPPLGIPIKIRYIIQRGNGDERIVTHCIIHENENKIKSHLLIERIGKKEYQYKRIYIQKQGLEWQIKK